MLVLDDPNVRELPDIIAVHGAPGGEVRTLFPAHLWDDARLFETAGWSFFPASAANHPQRRAARVFSDGERILLLDGLDESLNIRFQRDLPQAKISELLEQHGLEIVRPVPVAPNVFRVRSARNARHTAQDPLHSGEKIQRLAEVIYSEPEFIEAFPHR
jgi:hypothetical protein